MRVLLAAILLAGCLASPPAAPEAPAPLAVAWGGEDAPIRPGVRIGDEAPAGIATGRTGGCTGAFLFTDLEGNVFVSTAAHCLVGDDVNVAGAARAAVAYCSFAADGGVCATDPTSGDRNDFGLLALGAEDVALANPRVLGHDGPRGLAPCDEPSVGARVVAYGNSSYRPDVEPLKRLSGEVVAREDDFTLVVRFTPPAIPADSGSPVLTDDGRALAVLRALQPDGTNHVVCLDAALDAMRDAGGPDVRLAPG